MIPANQDWRTSVQRVWIIPKGNEGAGVEDTIGTEIFAFDTIVREGHTSELEVTENPVETGVVVSDHAFMKPARLEIEGAVGDVWLYGQDEIGNPIDDVFASSVSRSAVAFQKLLGLQRSAELFSVQTGLKLYPNMIVASLSADQDAETAAILLFRASLREVIRVSTRKVTFPPRKPQKPHRQGSKAVNGGEAKGTPASDQQCLSGFQSCAPTPTVAKDAFEAAKAYGENLLKMARGG